ncbi:MAG: hypothetical protein Q9N68_07535 [Gammaproteobacteria bacterium]|nr:hypothetical protein [Gammaproteobacteria bacterium]
MEKVLLTLATSLLILNACSDTSSNNVTIQTASGTFIDSRVAGLSYRSGAQSGNTNDRGQFIYEVGQPVNFFLGPIDFGSANVNNGRVMPTDLSSDANTITNISRFLLMLDSDGDASNGLQISTAVQTSASAGTGWSTIDFSNPNFETQNTLTSTVALIASLDGRASVLPTALEAETHLLASLRCQGNGAFVGSYTTDPLTVTSPTQAAPEGNIAFILDANSGKLSGTLSTQNNQHFFISAQHNNDLALGYTQNVRAYLDNSNTAYSGQLTSTNGIEGSWNDADTQVGGTFNTRRVGHSSSATQRYTALYSDSSGTVLGFYAFDSDANNTLSGIVYNYVSNTSLPLTANYSATTDSWFGSISDSTSFTLKSTGTTLVGDWAQDPVTSGSILGSGCTL